MSYRSKMSDSYYHNLKEEKDMRNNKTAYDVNAMNMEERKMDAKKGTIMDKIMRTGIIAVGTVAVTGLTCGMSPVEVHAAEFDTDAADAALQAPSEDSAPETLADARDAFDAAQAEAAAADVAVKEAEGRVSEAQDTFDTASEEAETARSEAEKAFEDARSEAARADEAAQNDVEAAERNAAEAEDRAQQAGEEAAAAEQSLEEAENGVREAVSEAPVTETDISCKEAELADAETGLAEAEKAYEEAESARNAAADEAQQKDAARDDARSAVKDAEAEKAEADAAALSAEEAAGQADKELQSAEDLKNGTVDIKDTVQYREEQAAKEAVDKASEAAGDAAVAADRAAADLEKAGAAVDAAGKELDLAAEDLNNRESELSEAEKAKKAADTAREKAQETYDKAAADAAGADAAVSEAEKAVTEAKDGVKAAEAAKTAADNTVKKAAAAVDAARQDAEAAIDADIAAAEKEAAEKSTATEAAQEALDAAAERYKQGTLGLIDWMLAKEGLTKEQKKDLTDARQILIDASKEDLSKWEDDDKPGLPEERGGKTVVIGDENDATGLENLLESIEVMKKINEIRATDDNYTGEIQRNASYTNFYLMAIAETSAMRGAAYRRHIGLSANCENLAYRYADPTVGWYDREKVYFDRIRDELGITEITSMDDVERISEEAYNRGFIVGHYTNLFMAPDQVMGVGFTRYDSVYSYDASIVFYADDRYNRAKDLYTVEEFEQLAGEYCRSVDKSACEAALNSAAAAQSEAEKRLQTLIGNKGTAVESAIKDAGSILASKKADALAAAQALTSVKETLAAAEKASQGAQAVKSSADQALQAALAALNKAAGESREADNGFALAEKARDGARQSVEAAESAMKDAIAGKMEAASALEEKKTALTDANTALHDAAALHAAAEKKLADLTSDDTVGALREQKRLAEIALQSALTNQGLANEGLRQAKAVLAQAETDASSAKTSLRKAEDRLAETAGVKDTAQKAADQTAEELKDLREQYASVLRAIAARDAAREKLDQAETARSKAESALYGARTGLAAAQAAKAVTADRLLRASGLSVEAALNEDIEDPDFIYLNGYAAAVRTADTVLHSARERLDNANAELASRKGDSENAKKAYFAALADLEIARNRAEISQADPDPVPELTPSDGTAAPDAGRAAPDANEFTSSASVIASDASGKDSGTAVRKTTQNVSESISKEADPVATGDSSNVMGWLAGLLASTGFMVLGSRRRKKKTGMNVR